MLSGNIITTHHYKRNLTVVKALPEESQTLRNLLTLYLHDLSEYTPDLDVNLEGFFEYDNIDLFWEVTELTPYLLKLNDKPVGFVLLTEPPYAPGDVAYCIHEFFVLRKYRRTGIGSAAISQIFQAHPGSYKIVQLKSNIPAINFWYNLYVKNNITYEESTFEMDGYPCLMQQFSV